MTDFLNHFELESCLALSTPLLSLDCLQIDAEAGKAVGIRQVTMNDPIFNGHFPGRPIMPGVMQVATMVQASKALLMKKVPADCGMSWALTGLKRIKFRKPVLPGATMTVSTEITETAPDGSVSVTVQNTTDGDLASAGTLIFAQRPDSYFKQTAPFEQTDNGLKTPPSRPGYLEELLAAESAPVFSGAAEIQQLIPHRTPFVMLDGAYNLGVSPETAIGYKNISANDMMLAHSRNGIFPGYLQIEAAAQLGCAHLLSLPENKGKLGIFMSIDSAVFHAPVFAGERLHIQASCKFGGRFGVASATLHANARLVTETEFKFIVADASVIQ